MPGPKSSTTPAKRKRRTAGEGSLYWVESRGRFAAARTVGVGGTGGSRRLVAYGRTKTEALARLTEKLDRLGGFAAAGRLPVGHDVTLSDWVAQWLTYRTSSAGRPLRPSTAESYRALLELHVLPTLGRRRLQTLRAAHVEDLLLSLAADGWRRERPEGSGRRGLSERTLRYIYQVLRSCLAHAVRRQLLTRNPCDAVDPPGTATARPDAWTAAEACTFLETSRAISRLWSLYSVALGTGMRRGELVALRWDDVDLDGAEITVRSTRSASGNEGEPKTAAGRRTIPVPDDIVADLRSHRATQDDERKTAVEAGVWTETGHVWTTGSGRPVGARNVNRDLERVIGYCVPPVARIPVHGLRHTHATLALRAGVPVHVVAARLGHADPTITMRTYAHVLADQARAAAIPLSRLLAQTPTEAEDRAN